MAELSAKRQRFNKWFEENYTGDESLVKEFEGKKYLMKRAPGESKPQNKGNNTPQGKGEGGMQDKLLGLSQGLAAGAGKDSILGKVAGAATIGGKFNPYAAAGAAIMGVAQQKAENKRIQKMADARATRELSKGEEKKGAIQGQIAGSIRQTLGSANRQRTVQM